MASLKEEKESIPPSETQENKRVERIKIMNTAETEAQKKLIKLLSKFPKITLAGDTEGDIMAITYLLQMIKQSIIFFKKASTKDL